MKRVGCDQGRSEALSVAPGLFPAGKYRIAATRKGKTLQRTVTVNGKGRREMSFHWPNA